MSLSQYFPEGYELGRALGYPECCINFFAMRAISFELGTLIPLPETWKMVGTGYVPCPICNAAKTEEELVQGINERRTVEVPFPFYDVE